MNWLELVTPHLNTIVFQVILPIVVAVIMYYAVKLAKYFKDKTGLDLEEYIKEELIERMVRWVIAEMFRLEEKVQPGDKRMDCLVAKIEQEFGNDKLGLINREYGSIEAFAQDTYKRFVEPQLLHNEKTRKDVTTPIYPGHDPRPRG